MSETLDRLLVTKLSPKIHDKLKEIAKLDRRTLSALSRIIIEDYIEALEKYSIYSEEQSHKTGGV